MLHAKGAPLAALCGMQGGQGLGSYCVGTWCGICQSVGECGCCMGGGGGTCVCGDVGREVIRLTQGQSQGQGPHLLLTPYTHGVPHVDCEGPCAVTRMCVDVGPAYLGTSAYACFLSICSSRHADAYVVFYNT
jgi:hypothetical protein